jgi:hypothetical protein
MSDNLDRLLKAAAARPETARAEFGFETRLLARLRAEREQEAPWLAWAWRLTPLFAAVTLLLAAWSYAGLQAGDLDLTAALEGESPQLQFAYHLTGGSE